MQRKIVLASGSYHRKKMLEQIGLTFEVCESDFEEDMSSNENPYELAKELATGKVQSVAKNYDDAIVIGADTFVIFNGKFIGKPKDEEDAKKILRNFSGEEHEIISGFAIIDTKNNTKVSDLGSAKVKFRKLTNEEIDDYVATGDPMGKAGAYALTQKAAVLIESIDGDFYSIIGFPLNKIFVELKKMGVNALKQ